MRDKLKQEKADSPEWAAFKAHALANLAIREALDTLHRSARDFYGPRDVVPYFAQSLSGGHCEHWPDHVKAMSRALNLAMNRTHWEAFNAAPPRTQNATKREMMRYIQRQRG